MKTYHKNPRQITERQFKDLEKWLEELGDLSGIVHDLNSDEVVGGNQRARVFDILRQENAPIVLTDEFDPPTKQGTVALGYIQWRGERYGYRQVRWTARQCEKANVVANRAGGAWDWDVLANGFEMGDLLEWGFTEWDFSMGQFGGEEWLPEPVDNTDIEGAGAESFRAIVRFANSEERDEFFERVGVEVDGAYPVTLDFATLVWGG